MRYYITPDDWEIAKNNGLNYNQVWLRVYRHGWKIERAVTQPIKKSRCHKKWIPIALANGIKKQVYYNRVSALGFTQEAAATTPEYTYAEAIRKRHANETNKVIPKDLIAIAKSNGIKYDTLYQRIINRKWDIERATTEPVVDAITRGKMGRSAKEKKYGNENNIIFASRAERDYISGASHG